MAASSEPVQHILWSQEVYGTSIPVIDEEHQTLFAMLNTLLDHSDDPVKAEQVLNSLIEYTVHHFNHEEVMMLQTNYPGYKQHKAAHDAFKSKALESKASFEQTKKIPDDLIIFLQTWIDRHIRKSDMHYIHYLKPYQHSTTYGILLRSLEDYTVSRFGQNTWKRVAKEMAFPKEIGFIDKFEDQQFLAAVTHVTNSTHVSSEEILQNIGYAFHPFVSQKRPDLIPYFSNLGSNFVSAIENIVSFHVNLKSSHFPDMQVPYLRILENRNGFLRFCYLPSRPLRSCLKEFIQGAIRYLAENIYHLEVESIIICDPPSEQAKSGEIEYAVRWTTAGENEDDSVVIDATDEDSEQLSMMGTMELKCPHSDPKYLMGLDGLTFYSVFPFHFAIDSKGRLIQAGKSLCKLIPDLSVGHRPQKFIAVTAPSECAGGLVFATLRSHWKSVFMLTCRKDLSDPCTFTMRGQFLRVGISKKKALVFCGSPVFHTKDEFERSGLTMNDYPLHDSSIMAHFSLWSANDAAAPIKDKGKRSEAKGTSGMLQQLFGGGKVKKSKSSHSSVHNLPPLLSSNSSSHKDSKCEKDLYSLSSKDSFESPSEIANLRTEKDDLILPPITHTTSSLARPSSFPPRLANLFHEIFLSAAIDDYQIVVEVMDILAIALSSEELKPFIFNLIRFYASHEKDLEMLRSLLQRSLKIVEGIPILRSETPTTRILSVFLSQECRAWYSKALADFFHQLESSKDKELNEETIHSEVSAILQNLRSSLNLLPSKVIALFQWTMTKAAQLDPALVRPVLGNLIILRGLNPMLLQPSANRPKWEMAQLKSVIKVSKLIMLSGTDEVNAPGSIETAWQKSFDTLVDDIKVMKRDKILAFDDPALEEKNAEAIGSSLMVIRDFIVRNMDHFAGNRHFEQVFRYLARVALSDINFNVHPAMI